MRDGKPDEIPTDMPRSRIDLWNDYEDGEVGMQIGPLETKMSPEEARNHADGLEDHISGTEWEDDEETQALINDLRERADAVDDT